MTTIPLRLRGASLTPQVGPELLPTAASFNNLPAELLHEILSYADTASLAALCLVSSRLAIFSMSPLYASVSARTSRQRDVLLETLLRRPDYAELVQDASFGQCVETIFPKKGFPSARLRWFYESLYNCLVKNKPQCRTHPLTNPNQLLQDVVIPRSLLELTTVYNDEAAVAMSLLLLPKVRHLQITAVMRELFPIVEAMMSHFRDLRSKYYHACCTPSLVTNGFNQLVTIDLYHLVCTGAPFPWHCFPSLKRFHCQFIISYPFRPHQIPSTERPKANSLEVLHISEAMIMNEEDNLIVFPSAPKLKHLVVEDFNVSNTQWTTRVPLSDHIETIVWNEGAHANPWWTCNARRILVPNIPSLKKLFVPAQSILTPLDDSTTHPQPLRNRLPANLEVLWMHNVYIGFMDEDEDLESHLQTLVSSPHKHLKYLILSEPMCFTWLGLRACDFRDFRNWDVEDGEEPPEGFLRVSRYLAFIRHLAGDLAEVGVTLVAGQFHIPSTTTDFDWPV